MLIKQFNQKILSRDDKALMIVSKIYGGLAGQMLQYALGKHLSLINDTDLFLDLSWYAYHHNLEFPREFKLNKLKTNYKIVDNATFLWKLRLTEKFGKINPLKLKRYHEEDYTHFSPEVLNLNGKIFLDGYFFSYKYFYPILNLLQREFEIKDNLDDRNEHQLDKIRNTNSVSVHFRRGDYALTSFHGMLEISYYKKAIKYLGEKFPDIHLYIFSDEPSWVRQNMFFGDFQSEIVDYNKDEFNYIDMELMKNCKHNIIANSGFSWWAAILNKNKNATVIAPKKWFNEGNTKADNIPPDWIIF